MEQSTMMLVLTARKTVNTPTLFMRVAPHAGHQTTLTETSEQAESLPIEARLDQSTENEISMSPQLITTSSASKGKEKEWSASIETVRGKENVPVTLGPLIRDL
ncbi:hypothetical protein JR316_0010555 [Psilocybe cubensis]|uniref:Uncharacterized protein n=1 Tax=Psilocybe cubensis TaxID=181762 RepID=A0ACB8GMM0_PSICU|nr:hypothetical protein JR316_0010555 [Psilocybe cubensis]KAH9476642.1 hypothetical protein JR316_0010555 [Psilocybe cubensis]